MTPVRLDCLVFPAHPAFSHIHTFVDVAPHSRFYLPSPQPLPIEIIVSQRFSHSTIRFYFSIHPLRPDSKVATSWIMQFWSWKSFRDQKFSFLLLRLGAIKWFPKDSKLSLRLQLGPPNCVEISESKSPKLSVLLISLIWTWLVFLELLQYLQHLSYGVLNCSYLDTGLTPKPRLIHLWHLHLYPQRAQNRAYSPEVLSTYLNEHTNEC